MKQSENDSSGIIDSCRGCGRLHTAHPVAKISKVKKSRTGFTVSLFSLSSFHRLSNSILV